MSIEHLWRSNTSPEEVAELGDHISRQISNTLRNVRDASVAERILSEPHREVRERACAPLDPFRLRLLSLLPPTSLDPRAALGGAGRSPKYLAGVMN